MDPIGNSEYRHHDLQGRILSKLKAADTEGQMLRVIMDRFEAALAEEAVVVSRKERKQLWAQTARIILEDILTNLEASTD